MKITLFRSIVALLTAGVAPTGCATSKLPPEKPILGKVEVQGHRGARGLRPENTIPAFDYALESGADVLEMDLGVTKDGKLVIYHDQTINTTICAGLKPPPAPKTTKALKKPGKKPVQAEPSPVATPAVIEVALNSLTLSELKKLDCGGQKNPRFEDQQSVAGTRIPTLDEFFDWIKNHKNPAAKTVRLNIEMKSEESKPALSPKPAQFARLLIDTLGRHKMLPRAVIQSFDHRTLIEARKLAPQATLAALVEDRPAERLVVIGARIGARIVSPNHEWLTEQDVRELHAGGLMVIPWTANTEKQWQRMLELGVDGIITDYPDRLISFLKSIGKR